MEVPGMFSGSPNHTTPSTSASASMNTYQPITTYGLQQHLQQQPLTLQQPSFMMVHYGHPQLATPNVTPSFSKPAYYSDASILEHAQQHQQQQHHQPVNNAIDATKLIRKSEAHDSSKSADRNGQGLSKGVGETGVVFPERPHNYMNYYADAPDDGNALKQLQKVLPDGTSHRAPVTTTEMGSSFMTSPMIPLASTSSESASFSQHLAKMASVQAMSSPSSTSATTGMPGSYFDKEGMNDSSTAQSTDAMSGLTILTPKPRKRKKIKVTSPVPSNDMTEAPTCMNVPSIMSTSATTDASTSSQPPDAFKSLDSMTSCPHCHKDITSVVVSTLLVAGVEKLHPSPGKCHNCLKELFSPSMLKQLKPPDFLSIRGQQPAGQFLQCPHCPKLYNRKDKLTIHIRSHTGERPFRCTYCDRGFARKDRLKLHTRSHTGEKPYKCSLCEKCFCRSDKLKIHRVRAHLDIVFRRSTDVSVPDFTSKLTPSEKAAAAAAVAATIADIANPKLSQFTQEMAAKFASDEEAVSAETTATSDAMPKFSMSPYLNSTFTLSERAAAAAAVAASVSHMNPKFSFTDHLPDNSEC